MANIKLDQNNRFGDFLDHAGNPCQVQLDASGNIPTNTNVTATINASEIEIGEVGILDTTDTPINPAKEDGNLATIAGKDFATQTTLSALNGKVTACNTGAVVVSSGAITATLANSAKIDCNSSKVVVDDSTPPKVDCNGSSVAVTGSVTATLANSAKVDCNSSKVVINDGTPPKIDANGSKVDCNGSAVAVTGTVTATLANSAKIDCNGSTVNCNGSSVAATCTNAGTFAVQEATLDACIASNIVAVHDASPSAQAVSALPSAYQTTDVIVAGTGTVIDRTASPLKSFSLQCLAVGGAMTTWSVDVQISLDGVTFATVLNHATADSDGTIKFTGDSYFPARYIRFNATDVTLNTATALRINILAQ